MVLIIGIGFVVLLIWALRMEVTGGVDPADQPDALELIIRLAIFSPVALYAASLMLLLRVKLTNDTLSSGSRLIFHRWPRSQVAAIDLRQHAFGRTARVLPFVVLRDGRSYPPLPLARLDPNTLLPWQRGFVPSVGITAECSGGTSGGPRSRRSRFVVERNDVVIIRPTGLSEVQDRCSRPLHELGGMAGASVDEVSTTCRAGGNPRSRWARGSGWACLWVAHEAVEAAPLNAPWGEAGRQRVQEVEEPLGDGLQVNRHEVAVQHSGDNSLALGDYFGHFRFGHSSMITLGCVRRHP